MRGNAYSQIDDHPIQNPAYGMLAFVFDQRGTAMRSIFRKILFIFALSIMIILLGMLLGCSGNNVYEHIDPSGATPQNVYETATQKNTAVATTPEPAGTGTPDKTFATGDGISFHVTPTPSSAPSETVRTPGNTPTQDPNEIFLDETPTPERPTPEITAAPATDVPPVPTIRPTPTMEPITGDYYGLTGKTYSDYPYLNSAEELWRIDNIIKSLITDDIDRNEKIRLIHEWMVRNIAFDQTRRSRHVNQIFSTGRATSQGYSEMFAVFMGEIDIRCKLISGTVRGENQSWNAVNIDGEWYYVDVTMDDPLVGGHSDYPDGSNLRYTYFLVTEAAISADHTASEELPSPSATSGRYHEEAVNKAKKELLTKLSAMIGSGEVENGFIIDGPEDIDNAFEGICSAVSGAAENGVAPFRFTVYAISGTSESIKELSADLLRRISDFATEAYKQKVNCTMRSQEQELFGTMICEINLS